jgi:hypothetical protein
MGRYGGCIPGEFVNTRREAFRRVAFARIHRPYTLVFALVFPIPGVAAIIVGDEISAAFANISADFVSRAMGVTMVAGSVLTLVGIMRGRSLWEAGGLTLIAAGCLVYGLGVLLGLGLAGLVAGTGFLAIAVGTLLRVVSLASAAHEYNGLGKKR